MMRGEASRYYAEAFTLMRRPEAGMQQRRPFTPTTALGDAKR